MFIPPKFWRLRVVFVVGLGAMVSPALLFNPALHTETTQEKQTDRTDAADPWQAAQVLRPAEFVREIGVRNDSKSTTIIYVGFRTLFEGGHIPGAAFHGTASTEKGLAELKKWLVDLPRSTNLVIYCGCCPFDKCPNIRPAYRAVREMGFTHVRVLVMPTSFAADWVEKGYPMEKGI